LNPRDMEPPQPRISASSYSNTAPLIWSFLYGSNHGKVELVLDNAPARSAELLDRGRVDAALTPVIAYQMIDGVRLVPDVCVGTRRAVRSVCLVTRGTELEDVRSVALDTSSRTSVVLTKILFREFLGFEPEWRAARPDVGEMLAGSDCALLIGDPALRIAESFGAEGALEPTDSEGTERTAESYFALRTPHSALMTYDLAELWHRHTGLGFVFAMWMSRVAELPIDLAAARDEGLVHIDEIAANYVGDINLTLDELKQYLAGNISYSVDEKMQEVLELYFELAFKNGLIERNRPLEYTLPLPNKP
jgi:chorismate dehydratase